MAMMTAKEKSEGVPWDEQGADMNLAEYLSEFRQRFEASIKEGRFNIADMDHGSENYAGFSNKRARIAAVKLDPSCKGKDFKEQLFILFRAAYGR